MSAMVSSPRCSSSPGFSAATSRSARRSRACATAGSRSTSSCSSPRPARRRSASGRRARCCSRCSASAMPSRATPWAGPAGRSRRSPSSPRRPPSCATPTASARSRSRSCVVGDTRRRQAERADPRRRVRRGRHEQRQPGPAHRREHPGRQGARRRPGDAAAGARPGAGDVTAVLRDHQRRRSARPAGHHGCRPTRRSSKLATMVREAETQASPTQRFTDRFERIFVPAVLGLVVVVLFAGPLVGVVVVGVVLPGDGRAGRGQPLRAGDRHAQRRARRGRPGGPARRARQGRRTAREPRHAAGDRLRQDRHPHRRAAPAHRRRPCRRCRRARAARGRRGRRGRAATTRWPRPSSATATERLAGRTPPAATDVTAITGRGRAGDRRRRRGADRQRRPLRRQRRRRPGACWPSVDAAAGRRSHDHDRQARRPVPRRPRR